jgi:hypothetical protein
MYRVAGRPIMETIGTLAKLPKVDDARKLARDSMAKAAAGQNPVAERSHREQRADVSTFRAVADRYIERYAKKHFLGEDTIAGSFLHHHDVADLLDGIESRGAPVTPSR